MFTASKWQRVLESPDSVDCHGEDWHRLFYMLIVGKEVSQEENSVEWGQQDFADEVGVHDEGLQKVVPGVPWKQFPSLFLQVKAKVYFNNHALISYFAHSSEWSEMMKVCGDFWNYTRSVRNMKYSSFPRAKEYISPNCVIAA